MALVSKLISVLELGRWRVCDWQQGPGWLAAAYYYRRLFTDAVRAVDAARRLSDSDPGPLVTTGTSQGGALSLVAASLHGGVAAAMPNVPFLCHIRRSAQLATTGPHPELVKWCHTHHRLVDRAFETLAYFDIAVLVREARCPAHFRRRPP